MKAHFKNGVKHGKLILWDESGQMQFESWWQQGRLVKIKKGSRVRITRMAYGLALMAGLLGVGLLIWCKTI